MPHDPTLVTLIAIAAVSWLLSIILAVFLLRDWGKGKRRNVPQ